MNRLDTLNTPGTPGIGVEPLNTPRLARNPTGYFRVPLATHRLANKVAFITGGGGKIGVETAARLIREGANVTLMDISFEALEEALVTLKDAIYTGEISTSRILTVVGDASKEEDMVSALERTVKMFKKLDIALLNAGVSYAAKPLLKTSEEEYDRVMGVNVKSAFLGLKHVGKTMAALGNGGSIILTSSIAGLRGAPGLSVYSASKFALRGLATTAATELGPSGIRVNTIHPSGLGGPSFQQSWTEEQLEEMKKGMPLGRFAETHDVSSVVAFLGHEDSKFITGSFLKIDGGAITF
ncbi:NAD(P)-binding protein [Bimuria novae-zelandiae CBS 107.79]|uniref:NAD(P)-binding protein n=1 Tax=Bimuria novae-zelandiae CBS 107.79 TaxID=1447943 RepID=A0A6A5VG97_9PLEO|nr:NAD(P)-binding protein [Bimuria novae-zelandiae CBS 107.79]